MTSLTIPIRRFWNQIHVPLFLLLTCFVVGCTFFGFSLLAGILPGVLWFDRTEWYWPMWFVFSSGVAVLSILWVLSTHFSSATARFA